MRVGAILQRLGGREAGEGVMDAELDDLPEYEKYVKAGPGQESQKAQMHNTSVLGDN